MATAGQIVRYVPSIDHARDQDRFGTFAWSFAWASEKDGKMGDILTDQEVSEKMKLIRRMGKMKPPIQKIQHLVPVAPKTTWPATVTKVNDDGTCDLDIQYCLTGVTHSYASIKEDASGKVPNTFHVPTVAALTTPGPIGGQ